MGLQLPAGRFTTRDEPIPTVECDSFMAIPNQPKATASTASRASSGAASTETISGKVIDMEADIEPVAFKLVVPRQQVQKEVRVKVEDLTDAGTMEHLPQHSEVHPTDTTSQPFQAIDESSGTSKAGTMAVWEQPTSTPKGKGKSKEVQSNPKRKDRDVQQDEEEEEQQPATKKNKNGKGPAAPAPIRATKVTKKPATTLTIAATSTRAPSPAVQEITEPEWRKALYKRLREDLMIPEDQRIQIVDTLARIRKTCAWRDLLGHNARIEFIHDKLGEMGLDITREEVDEEVQIKREPDEEQATKRKRQYVRSTATKSTKPTTASEATIALKKKAMERARATAAGARRAAGTVTAGAANPRIIAPQSMDYRQQHPGVNGSGGEVKESPFFPWPVEGWEYEDKHLVFNIADYNTRVRPGTLIIPHSGADNRR